MLADSARSRAALRSACRSCVSSPRRRWVGNTVTALTALAWTDVPPGRQQPGRQPGAEDGQEGAELVERHRPGHRVAARRVPRPRPAGKPALHLGAKPALDLWVKRLPTRGRCAARAERAWALARER